MTKPVVLKKNNSVQRSDTVLTQDIACSLTEMILSGRNVYDKSGIISYININKEGEEKVVKIKVNSLRNWIRRRNIIPETGETLKDVLDIARENYRTQKEEKRRQELLGDADREIKRTLNIKTRVPVVGAFGLAKDPDTKEIIYKEDAYLLRIKVDTAKFVKERLDPARWGNVQKVEGRHLHVFSLADLRKAKIEKDKIVSEQ